MKSDILLVENDADHVELIKNSFETARDRLNLRVSKDLKQAREDIQTRKPDLVICDLLLPDGRGDELLRASTHDFPILIITSQGDEQIAVEAIKAGAIDYIVKSPASLRSLPDLSLQAIRDWNGEQEQKRIKYELSKLSQALEQSPVSVIITTLDGSIEYVNLAFCEITGYSRKEVLGKNPRFLKSKNKAPETYQKLWETISRGEVWKGEFINLKKNGEVFWEAATISPIRDRDGRITHYLGVKEDITEKKLAAREREEYREKLELMVQDRTRKLENALLRERELQKSLQEALQQEKELGQLKTRLVSMVSHEFRTPLSIILSSSDILKKYGDRLKENQKEGHLERIIENVQLMNSFLEDTLVLGKLDSDKQIVKPVIIDIPVFLQSILEEILGQAGDERIININYIKTRSTCTTLLMDKNYLWHIFYNLIWNAVKYSSPAQVIDVEIEMSPHRLQLTVRDQGIGIPLKDQRHLFEPFHRGANTDEIVGSGLGLTVVKRTLDKLGGSIEFTSQPGEGSEFQVSIPHS